MKKIFIYIFIFLLSISYVQAKDKNLLVINSYHKGFTWSDIIIKGMEKNFKNTNIDMSILYMDSKRVNSKEYYEKLKDLYKIQLAKHKYDLIVAIDTFSYKFILQNYKYFQMEQPIFFIGIEQFSQEEVKKYNLEDKVSGILERRAIDDNLKIITKIVPNLKKLYIINDKSANGDDTEPFIAKAIQENKNRFEIEYIRKISFMDLQKKFSKFSKNEAIFFIRFYNDSSGKLYTNDKIASFIDKAKIPVFVTDELFIDSGALGGKLVDIEKLGTQSAIEISNLLNGKHKISNIQIAQNFNYKLDYKKLKQFGISYLDTQKQFTIINSPKGFLDKHREFVDFVFLSSPFLVLLILGLVHNIYLRIQNTKRLKQRMQFDKELLNALRSPTIWQDEKGKTVDCNIRFEEFLDKYSYNGKFLRHYEQEHDLKYLIELLKNSLHEAKSHNEVTLQNRDGKDTIFMLRQRKYTENIYDTSGVVTVFTNITTEKLALLEKTKHQEFIIQQSKLAEIGEIFSSIAHQWKSPLVEIAAIVQEQLYLGSEEVDERNSSYVKDVMVQVKYMTETIGDFQEFIKPSNKKVKFNIHDEVQKILQIIDHNIRYNYIHVKIEVKHGSFLEVYGYKNELKQILLNIINNAKDAIVKQKAFKSIEKGQIDIKIQNIDNFVQITIEDNGGGVPKENLDKIFNAYFTTKENGHGIGLYMARLIIEDKMGGEIKVKNANNGAKFIIKLEQNDENIST